MHAPRFVGSLHRVSATAYVANRPLASSRMRKTVFIVLQSAIVGVFSFVLLRFGLSTYVAQADNLVAPAASPYAEIPPSADTSATSVPDEKQEESWSPEEGSLQAALDAWIQKKTGQYSVHMTHVNSGTLLASHDEQEQYFSASIYKLYVAYVALQNVQNGTWKLEDRSWNGLSLKECIDKMIRESHSPCGEAVLQKIGKLSLTTRLKELGLRDTNMVAFMTTAQDAALLTKRLAESRDISEEGKLLLLDAMRSQIYREGIPTGAGSDVEVADKVGFFETGYHDVALLTLPNGEQVILSIFSANASSRQIADLTRTLLAAVPQQ